MGTAVPEWFRACLAWQRSAVLARESRQPWVSGEFVFCGSRSLEKQAFSSDLHI